MKTYLRKINPKVAVSIYILVFILPTIYDTYNYLLNNNINLFKPFPLIYLVPLAMIPFLIKYESTERNIFILQCFSISLGAFYAFKYLIIFRLVSSTTLLINLYILFLVSRGFMTIDR